MAWYLESTKAKGLRFKIVSLDKATMNATLLGDTGVPFDRNIGQDVLTKLGYIIVQIEEPVHVSALEDSAEDDDE